MTVFHCRQKRPSYFPIAWGDNDAVDEVYYELSNISFDNFIRDGILAIVKDHFNACVGGPFNYDHVDHVGMSGIGPKSERGHIFTWWVLQQNLQIVCRAGFVAVLVKKWPCVRTMGGAHLQLFLHFFCPNVWSDFATGVGLYHPRIPVCR